ncbi:MAG: tetratricopeptide repeat protein [Deinococcales bacterium]
MAIILARQSKKEDVEKVRWRGYQQALDLLRSHLESQKQLRTDIHYLIEVRGLLGLGHIFSHEGNSLRALTHYEIAQGILRTAIQEQNQAVNEIIYTLRSQGRSFLNLERPEKAIEFFRRALDELNGSSDNHREIRSMLYGDLVNAYRKKAKKHGGMESAKALNEASLCLEEARKIVESYLNKRAEAYFYYIKGQFLRAHYQDAQDHEGAKNAYLKSHQILKKIGFQYQLGLSTLALGKSYQGLGSFDDALKYYRESIAIFEVCGHKRPLIHAYNALADLYFSYDDFGQARSFYEKARDLIDMSRNELITAMRWFIPHDRATGETFIGLGRIHLYGKNFEEASRFFNDAIDIFDVIEHPFNKARAYYFLAKTRLAQEQKYPALNYFSLAKGLFNQVDANKDVVKCIEEINNLNL